MVTIGFLPVVAGASFSSAPWLRYTFGVTKFDPVMVTGRFTLLNPEAGLIDAIIGEVPGFKTVKAFTFGPFMSSGLVTVMLLDPAGTLVSWNEPVIFVADNCDTVPGTIIVSLPSVILTPETNSFPVIITV